MPTSADELTAADAAEFIDLLRTLVNRSGVTAGQIAHRAGIPRSQAYALIRPGRTVLPTNQYQVIRLAAACGLTDDMTDQVRTLWGRLREAESGLTGPTTMTEPMPAATHSPEPILVDGVQAALRDSRDRQRDGARRWGTSDLDSIDLMHELNDVRRGRGLCAANLGSRIGPRLRRACRIKDTDSDAVVRKKVVRRLSALCEELPQDLATAASVALALHEETGEFLDRRIMWLAQHFDRDPRTARRRVDTAFRLLGERLAEEDAPAEEAVAAETAEEGCYVESLRAVLRMDLDPPQLVEECRIVACVDDLKEITVSMRAPRGVPLGYDPIEATMVHGGEIVKATPMDNGQTQFLIRLSETLRLGQRYEYGIRFTSYPRSWTNPYDLLAPQRRCEHFAVRVRFGDTRPDLVWQLEREGMSYGLQWSA